MEYFPVVDSDGKVISKASRTECHSGSLLLHPVVHLHVFDAEGRLYLQKRADNKDIQPGKWDTSVGGHVDYGEDIETALMREVREELGITDFNPVFILRYEFRSEREAELVHSYYTIYSGEIQPDIVEISEGKFWDLSSIVSNLSSEIFTPNFVQEFKQLMAKNLLPFQVEIPIANSTINII